MTHGWRLTVRDGAASTGAHDLAIGVWTLGRSVDNDVVLPGARMSRFHAALFVSPEGECHLQDMGSKNGTLVGERRIGRIRLKPGDRFHVGSFECEASLSDQLVVSKEASTLETISTDESDPDPTAEGPFLGRTQAARKLIAQARRAADTELNVLIRGESGSGKGVVAQLIHHWSARSAAPFVVVNCAAIPAELVESELFGHRRGSFTGAVADRPGKFRTANGGTLFLDEVGDLPLPAQAKILRAIEEQEVEPLGEPSPVKVDVRVLAATHQDLEKAVSAKRFRLDLYHRLATISLKVPALRERRDDIILLANCFLADLIDDIPWAQGATLSEEAVNELVARDWPGNVRELRNVVAQAMLARKGDVIGPEEIRLTPSPSVDGRTSASATLAEVEARHIEAALQLHKFNLRQAAKSLGIARSTLHERMDKLGIERRSDRDPGQDDAD